MNQEAVIIGGGPAGAAAAITLARAGHRPMLIERDRGPADKVCGDFLSADTFGLLRALGVDPMAMGGAPIRHVRLIHGETVAELALPFPAVGLSRRALDAALLQQAAEAGSALTTGQSVRRLTRRGAGWALQLEDGTSLMAESVFQATGKHDLRDLPRPRNGRDAIGMKMYFALSPEAGRRLDGCVELTLFPGGYAGMQHVEGGRSILCIAVQRAAFQGLGATWNNLLDAIGQGSLRFASMLLGARALLPRPLAVAGIPYGYQARSAALDGLFQLGDQAAVIPSLTGDGMAIALHSGIQAARAWMGGAGSTPDRGAVVYRRGLERTLAPGMRLAWVLHRLCLSGTTQPTVVRAARLLPVLPGLAARYTRLPADLTDERSAGPSTMRV